MNRQRRSKSERKSVRSARALYLSFRKRRKAAAAWEYVCVLGGIDIDTRPVCGVGYLEIENRECDTHLRGEVVMGSFHPEEPACNRLTSFIDPIFTFK